MARKLFFVLLFLVLVIWLAGNGITWQTLSATSLAQTIPAGIFSGQVTTASHIPIRGATVYLIPTTAIDMTAITASDIYYAPFPAEAYDEPLEDALRAQGENFPQAVTDATGAFTIDNIPDGKFFVHVTPDAADQQHLPGGDKSKESYSADELRGQTLTIYLSSRPPAHAVYVGSTRCLECHTDHSTFAQTGHKLAWAVPGQPSPLQDFSRFPEYFNALAAFKTVEQYTEGTHLELGDRDSSRDTDKFKIRTFEDERLPISTVFADLYLWKDAAGKHYITLANRLNPDDPNSPVHLEVKLTYGGMVHRQRYIVSVPESLGIRQGHYTVLQSHPEGHDYRLNRTRREWRDYKFYQWWGAGADEQYGTADDRLQAPPINDNTIEVMCAGCHVTGYESYLDEATGQYLVRGVDDPNGDYNIDSDPSPDEINIGCETCHGPGSEHVEYAGLGYELVEPAIVNPNYLSAERANVLCGRCHDRRQGVGGPTLGYAQAINEQRQFMQPGESRHTLLAEYTDPAKKGPIPNSEIWQDNIHSKSPHQQYADFLKSGMYRNDRILVTCQDCHDLHGNTPYRRWLIADPDDPNSPLCQRCHEVDINAHMEEKLNSKMKGAAGTRCIDCHMPGTMVAGGDAGDYARFISTPPYTDAAAEKQNAYWEGHINSHVFDVPRKTNIAVRGVAPGDAMPIPYTNSCGTCHVVSELPYK